MKILIIGGGVMGLTCAWKLAHRGRDDVEIHLFDGRATGGGASGASLGALWPASALVRNPLQQLHRQSLWRFDSFLDTLAAASETMIPFHRVGRLELLNSPKAFARAQEEVAAANMEWPALVRDHPAQEVLTPAAVQEMLPTLAVSNHGAILCHNSAQVHIPSLLDALKSACLRANVHVHEQSAVTAVDVAAREVTTAGGVDRGDVLLVTSGAWTGRLLPAVPITPAKGQALALRKPEGLALRQIVKSGGTYLVSWRDEVLVGATTEASAGFDEMPTAEAREKLLAGAAALLPELAHATVLRHWSGLRPDGPGHQPLMGVVPGSDGTYVCAGHYKVGIALAPLVSDLMASLILDGIAPAELLPFRPQACWP